MTTGLILTYGCLIPLILIDLVYLFQEKKKSLSSSFFKMLITVDILMIISEVLSSHLLFNDYNVFFGNLFLRTHWLFGILLFYSMFIYSYCIIRDIKDLTFKDFIKNNKLILVVTIITIIICILYLVLPLPKLDHSEFNYLPGWLAYGLIGYASILITVVMVYFFMSKNKLKEHTIMILTMGIIPFFYVGFQILFKGIALGPIGASFIIIIFYMAVENPNKYITEEMKKYNHVLEKNNYILFNIITDISKEANDRVTEVMGLCAKYYNAPVINREELYPDINKMNFNIRDLSFIMNNRVAILSNNQLVENNHSEFDVLETIKRFCKFAYQKNNKPSVKFILEIDEGIPKTIVGDEDAFYYLLTNAFDSSYKNTMVGKITIKIRKDPEVKNRIIINVVDTGEGRTKEEYTNIEHVDVNYIIMKKYLGFYNGVYSVNGELNLGTTLNLYLNINPSSEEFIEKQVIENVALPSNNLLDMQRKKVLIVENNEINYYALSQLLALYNVELHRANGVNSLVNDVKQGIKYDYVFIDMLIESNSKDIAGSVLKLCDEFEVEKPKIIALCPFKTKKYENDCLIRGYYGCISQGIEIDELNKVFN